MSRSEPKSVALVLAWLHRQVRLLLERARSHERAPGGEHEALLQVVLGRLGAIVELLDAVSVPAPARGPVHAPRIELADDLLSVPLGGVVDRAAVEALWGELASVVEGARVTLIIDASGTVSLDDAGAVRLVEAWRAFAGAGHGFIVCGASARVAAALRAAGSGLPLVDSFREAVSLAFERA